MGNVFKIIAFIFLLSCILHTCTYPALVPKKKNLKLLNNNERFFDISVFSIYGIFLPLRIELEPVITMHLGVAVMTFI